jgi:hypothetical protein
MIGETTSSSEQLTITMLGRINLSTVLLGAGGLLTLIGFIAYFQDNATLNLAGFSMASRYFWG